MVRSRIALAKNVSSLSIIVALLFASFSFGPIEGQQLDVYTSNADEDRIQKFTSNGTFVTRWGSGGVGTGEFLHIHGIAVDQQGNVYAADEERSDIQKFDSNGKFITKWGTKGIADGQFSSQLEDITVDSNGNVYVVDYGRQGIRKFTSDGTFITDLGSKGTGDGQFDRPWGVAVDSLGNVYVTDRDNSRVQKFTSDGTFITKWGTSGTDVGQFGWPMGIAINQADNTVFVTDEKNNAIQKFDTDGKFITKWGTKGGADGQFNGPHGITISSDGEVYVVDTRNQRVQKFTLDGAFISTFGSKGIHKGELLMPQDVAIDSSGNTYVSDQKFQHPELDAVKSFLLDLNGSGTDTSGIVFALQNEYYTFAMKWGSLGFGDGQFERPHDIEFDSLGNVYISDRDRNDIQVFSPSGEFLYKFGSSGTASGEFNVPYSISIDQKNDYLYVADRGNDRIQKFYTDGTFVEEFRAPGGKSIKAFSSTEDLVVDPNSGFIYIADTGNNRVVKVDRNFEFVLEWGSEGTGPGQFRHPHGIGVDSHGNVYVNDLESPRIQKFDGNGNFIKQWGSAGTGDGQLSPPLEHLAVDPFDNVWMVDGADNPRILKFDSNGTFLGSVGSGPCVIEDGIKDKPLEMMGPLPCDGKMHKPEHVSVDAFGNLYVVDRGNQRIEVFLRSESTLPVSGGNCLQRQLGGNPCLSIQTLVSGLKFPTGIAFLSEDDMLVIEKNQGTVRRITDGHLLDEPLLKVDIATESNEQGMLGIAVANSNIGWETDENVVHVFLYYTEAEKDGITPLGNRLYRYELVNDKLTNPKLLFGLPAGLAHNGGVITIGPDNNVYLVVGNLFSERLNQRPWDTLGDTLAQNVAGAPLPDGRGGILRFTQDGGTVNGSGILGESNPLDKYYAYGIRNSFGIGFDPVTGKLWDTENGPDFGDEINLVLPGFNSGSNPIHGVAGSGSISLVNFDGKGKYSDPEFTWDNTVAPTSIAFLDSDLLGKEYQNDLFVGSGSGLLFHFDLNEDRTSLSLGGLLTDKVSNNVSELEPTIFGSGFGIITDIKVGPDGYLYVVSMLEEGKVFRIGPMTPSQPTRSQEQDSFIVDFGRIQKFSNDGKFITKWGSKGTGDGEFLHIHGIAADSNGTVYATDEERGIVQKFSNDGKFITKWGSEGKGDGQFSSKIEDITVDSDGKNVYVVDYGLNRIQKFDSNGNFITKWGSKGTGDGQFDRPWGVAVDSVGNVYVTDQRNNRIQKFDSNGQFITKWGSEGAGDGQFVHLHAIAIDSDDNIYVSDARENSRIEKFTSDGKFITKWGVLGTGDGQFKEQHGIAIDSLGNVYVADTANQRIQKFTSEGVFIDKWDVKKGYQFIMPQDITIDGKDQMYLSDVADAHPEISYVRAFLVARGYVPIDNSSSAADPQENSEPTTFADSIPVEIGTDTGDIYVLVMLTPTQKSGETDYSVKLNFLDPFSHSTLDGDVIYDIRIIDSNGKSVYSKNETVARHATDTQVVHFPKDESYSFEVEVVGLLTDGKSIDTTRNGIAKGIMVVPEFSSQIGVIIAITTIMAAMAMLTRKYSK